MHLNFDWGVILSEAADLALFGNGVIFRFVQTI